MVRVLSIAAVLAAIALAGCGSATAGPKPTAPSSSPQPFSHVPAMAINTKRQYTATVSTTDGTFKIALDPRPSPVAVNNFIFLARHHFYDHVIFHRIMKSFFIQTGDPTGTGFGGPGYTFTVEKPTTPYTVGTVAMARTKAPHSNGSQFFVIVGPPGTQIPRDYTILGHISSGMNVCYKIANTPVAVNPGNNEVSDPLEDVRIKSITIS